MSPCVKIALLVLSSCLTMYSGPFGLTMGMTDESFGSHIDESNSEAGFLIFTTRVPEPNLNFERYCLMFGRDSGLAKVMGRTALIRTDPSGVMLSERFQEMAGPLIEKHGEPSSKFNMVKMDSKYKSPDNWMLALKERDRVVAGYWFQKEGKVLPDNIASITIEAFAVSEYSGWIEVTYEFDNWHSIADIIKDQRTEIAEIKAKQLGALSE